MSTSFQFFPESHAYLVEGVQVPSVTQLLERSGLVNYDGIPEAVLDHKAEIGTAAHAACHYLDEGDLEWSTVHPEVGPYVRAWERFRMETNFEPRLIEQRGIAQMAGMRYGYTLDREGVYDGRDAILEIKCTAGIEISWGPQLAAYENAVRAQDGKSRMRVAVHLLKTGRYELIRYSSVTDYQVFQSALFLDTWKKGKGKTNGFGNRNPR